jgi:tetratricopeptide (TPR) repeat protein
LEALEIDDELGAAYAVLGWIGFYYDWDWGASERNYRQALDITPGDFSARLGYAHLLSNTYRSEEAIREVDRALAADSLSPLAGTLKSQFLFYAGGYAEAHEQLQRTFKISPAFWIGQVLLGRMYLREGRHDDAVAEFTKATDAGVWTPRALAAYTYAVSGRRDEALRMLTEMVGSPGSAAPPYLVALVHLGLDDRPQALTWLERAYEEKDVRMVFLGVDPLWATLRDEERFANLLRRMNL